MANSAVFYKSLFDALAAFPPARYKRAMQALAEYTFTGKEPEGLPLLESTVFILSKPLIDRNSERREEGVKGGRPQKELPADAELQALYNGLGSWDAVADRLGVSRATLFRRKGADGDTVSNPCRKISNVAKPNVDADVDVDADADADADADEERGAARDARQARQAAPAPSLPSPPEASSQDARRETARGLPALPASRGASVRTWERREKAARAQSPPRASPCAAVIAERDSISWNAARTRF